MLKSLLDGANIQNCGDTNEISPQRPEQQTGPINCHPGYSGPHCDIITDICLANDPCENNGICEAHGESFICNCPIHYTGDICQHSAPIEFSAQYNGNSYIELNRSSLLKSSDERDVLIAVLFSTTSPNGLLVWYGQDKHQSYAGQDFIALAIVDGYVEISFRLNSEEAGKRYPNKRVDDGARHIAIIKRVGHQATLELDNQPVQVESRPTDRDVSHLPGNVFLGGAPDMDRLTGHRYKQGFVGCINIVEGADTGAINIRVNAVGGYNVIPCPE